MAGQNQYPPAAPFDGTEDIAVWQHGATRTATTAQLVALVPRVATDVGAFVLFGLTTVTNAAITATDTIVAAFGKVQAQITSEVARARASEGALQAQITALNIGTFVLAGLSTATNTVITGADTLLVAFGKLQAQITALKAGGTKISQSPTGQFFTQNGASINRMNDRLFVGGATVNDGAFPNVTQDWLQTFLASSPGGSEAGPMVSTTAAVLSNFGTFGLTAGSRTSDNPNAGSGNTIGLASFAINNNTTNQSLAWAYYGEGRKLAGVETTQTFGMELDVSNQGLTVTAHPYQQLPGGTICLQLASGCGVALPGNNTTSCAIQIVNNQTKFDRGIVVGATAVNGTDGVTGAGVAMALAKGHSLTWFNSAGNETSIISGNVATATQAIEQVFDDAGVHFKNASLVDLFDIQATASAANGITLVPGGVGSPVQLQAFGSDTNINFYVLPKGTGIVNLSNAVYVEPVSSPANQLGLYGNIAGSAPAVAAIGSDTNIDLTLAAKGTGQLNLGTGTTNTASAGTITPPSQVAGYMIVKISGASFKIPYYNT